ncbi:MAG: diguanylate cyclase [Steroidobacteraceae bacterium]|jgi:diguanylate cyclase (GGDEF)-like protein|nr:diguanylate cyclase [Steroidobacteraceae bacterium]
MALTKPSSPSSSDAARTLAKGFRSLRFDEPLESEFRAEHRARMRGWNRVAIWLSACTVLGYAVLDHFVLSTEHARVTHIVRFAMHVPAVVIMLICTSKRFYTRWYDLGISLVAPLFGIGIVLMAAFSPPAEVPLVGGRLLLVAFFFYFMIGLRFREALRANLIVFAALTVASLATAMPGTTAGYLLFTLFVANLIGIVGSYALEHANRTAFLEHRQLTEVATHDGLTTLLNRAAFEDQIRRVWQQAQRDRQTVSVIMIDIDYFKAYNDRYGHIAGDDCLRRVSSALRDAARRRPLDFVARYGGEELVAVLYGADKAYGESISRGLLTAVRELRIPHADSQTQPYVTVSVGVVSVDAYRMATHDAAVGLADQALYAAKKQGRDRFVVTEHVPAKVDPAATTVLPLRGEAFREASGS